MSVVIVVLNALVLNISHLFCLPPAAYLFTCMLLLMFSLHTNMMRVRKPREHLTLKRQYDSFMLCPITGNGIGLEVEFELENV